MLTLTWANRNRVVQADIPVDHFEADTGLEAGQQTIIEWRWRADPGDAWGAATINTVTMPATASYDPPGDGWVQVKVYSIRDGLVSWQYYLWEAPVVGGVVPDPAVRITEASDRRITESGDVRITEY